MKEMPTRELHHSLTLLKVRQTDTAFDVRAELMRILPRREIGRNGDGERVDPSDKACSGSEEVGEARVSGCG